MLVVFTTAPTVEEANDLASKIVEEKLAACVQILPPMTSYFFWEGRIQQENEHLILVKTLEEEYSALEKFLIENHSYDVPEVVAVRAEHVSGAYLSWMENYLT